MWKAYLNVIEKVCTNALNTLDRFHVKGHLTDAVNETRKMDVAKLKKEGREAVLLPWREIFHSFSFAWWKNAGNSFGSLLIACTASQAFASSWSLPIGTKFTIATFFM